MQIGLIRWLGLNSLLTIVERSKHYLQQPPDLVRDLMLDGSLPFVVNVPDTDEEPAIRM